MNMHHWNVSKGLGLFESTNLEPYQRKALISLILCYESEIYKKGIIKLLSFLFIEMIFFFFFLKQKMHTWWLGERKEILTEFFPRQMLITLLY